MTKCIRSAFLKKRRTISLIPALAAVATCVGKYNGEHCRIIVNSKIHNYFHFSPAISSTQFTNGFIVDHGRSLPLTTPLLPVRSARHQFQRRDLFQRLRHRRQQIHFCQRALRAINRRSFRMQRHHRLHPLHLCHSPLSNNQSRTVLK